MIDRTANLLGVVGLAVAERIEQTARDILNHTGETPAALVVIGYGLGPSNEQLRRILGLSHPGSVRLIDRLVADGLVERREGSDRRAIALYLTDEGMVVRDRFLKGRVAAIRPLLMPLTSAEQEALGAILARILSSMETTDLQRCALCRLCDDSVCTNCPIPADFRGARRSGAEGNVRKGTVNGSSQGPLWKTAGRRCQWTHGQFGRTRGGKAANRA